MSYSDANQEVSLVDCLRIILKHKKTWLVFLGLAVVIVWIWAMVSSPTYQAEAIVKIGQVGGQSASVAREGGDIQISGQLIQSSTEAAAFLGVYPSVKSLGNALTIKPLVGAAPESVVVKDTLLFLAKATSAETANEIIDQTTEILLAEHQRIFDRFTSLLDQREEFLKAEQGKISQEIIVVQENIAKVQAVLGVNGGATLSGYLNRLSVLEDKQNDLSLLLLSLGQAKAINNPTKVEVVKTAILVNHFPFQRNLSAAMVLGLFLGGVTSFTQEWWQKNKFKIKRARLL